MYLYQLYGPAVMIVKDPSASTDCTLVGTPAAIYRKTHGDGTVHRLAK